MNEFVCTSKESLARAIRANDGKEDCHGRSRMRRWRSNRSLLANGHGAVMPRRLKLPPRPAMYGIMEHARISHVSDYMRVYSPGAR
jgi:hypothetical protein